MRRCEDLTGQPFGKWKVLALADVKNHKARWHVECECGNQRVVYATALKSGGSTSCGQCAIRPAMIHGDTVSIPLTRGQTALVDLADYQAIPELSGNWCALWSELGQCYYAVKRRANSFLYLHRVIMNAPEGTEVDHKDGNTLDNRRSNLRVCSHAENCRNMKTRPTKTSQFKGVYWDESRGNWAARVTLYGKGIHLGRFDSEEEAAQVYDQNAMGLFGQYARLNSAA